MLMEQVWHVNVPCQRGDKVSDIQKASGSTTLEKIFDLIGWVGFIFMIPVTLGAFGMSDFAKAVEKTFGTMGSANALLAMFYGCQLARTIFGSGTIILPLVMGSLSSFAIIAATGHIGFMSWWKDLLSPLGWFADKPLALLVGLLTLMFAYLLSRAKQLAGIAQVFLLFVLPVAVIALLYYNNIQALLGLGA